MDKVQNEQPDYLNPILKTLYLSFKHSQGNQGAQKDIFTLLALKNALPTINTDIGELAGEATDNLKLPPQHQAIEKDRISGEFLSELQIWKDTLEKMDKASKEPHFSKELKWLATADDLYYEIVQAELNYQIFPRPSRSLDYQGQSFSHDPHSSFIKRYAIDGSTPELPELGQFYSYVKDHFYKVKSEDHENFEANLDLYIAAVHKVKAANNDYYMDMRIVLGDVDKTSWKGTLSIQSAIKVVTFGIIHLWEKNHPGKKFFPD